MNQVWQFCLRLHKKYPVLLLVVIWILLILSLRIFAVRTMHQPGNSATNPPEYSILFAGATKFDGLHYFHIAEYGYPLEVSPLHAFYPGYPLLLRLIHRLLHLNYGLASFLINVVATILSGIGLYALALQCKLKSNVATWVVIVWLAWPASHFLLATYSEALFSALSIWALVWALRERWLVAFLLAGLSSFVRFPGVLIGLAVLFHFVYIILLKKESLTWRIALIPLAFSGVAMYWYWLWITQGNPIAVISEAYQLGWPYNHLEINIFKTFWDQIVFFGKTWSSTVWPDDWINQILIRLMFIGGWLSILLGGIWSIKRKLPKMLSLYILGLAIMLLLTGNFISHSRYSLTAFPLFIVIAIWLNERSEIVRNIYLMGSFMALGVMLSMFANGYWVG